MLDRFIAKYSPQKRIQLSHQYKITWESDDYTNLCRNCFQEFYLFRRKHHCRSCGSIYCDDCCISEEFFSPRKCIYCRLFLSPGLDIIQQIQIPIQNSDRFQVFPLLQYGSDYDENFVRPNNLPAHTHGYFQFTNRSNEMCCIKLVKYGSQILNEAIRPPYYSGK